MEQVSQFFGWLFGTRPGVMTLVGGGIVLFFIISLVLERRTHRLYKNHEKSEGDWDLFDVEDDSESGWSAFDDDNL